MGILALRFSDKPGRVPGQQRDRQRARGTALCKEGKRKERCKLEQGFTTQQAAPAASMPAGQPLHRSPKRAASAPAAAMQRPIRWSKPRPPPCTLLALGPTRAGPTTPWQQGTGPPPRCGLASRPGLLQGAGPRLGLPNPRLRYPAPAGVHPAWQNTG